MNRGCGRWQVLPFISVLLPACSIVLFVFVTHVFDHIQTENGFEHYAESVWPMLPWLLAMPFNALVNVLYLIVGFNWLHRRPDSFDLNVFSWMSILYGFVQYCRIVTQQHRWAVIDQWCTLPLFAWAYYLFDRCALSSRRPLAITIELLSCLSFMLTLVHNRGFEFALGLHIILVVRSAVRLQFEYGNRASGKCLAWGIVCCLGFVLLKLLDHHLAAWQPNLFRIVSGHFCSKICDAFQFHWAFAFYINIEKEKKKKLMD